MFNVGGPELLVILLLALIVLGPSRLPDAARQVGKMMGEVRKLSSGFQDEVKNAFNEVDSPTSSGSHPTGAATNGSAAKGSAAPAAAKRLEARGERAEAMSRSTPRPRSAPAKKRSAPLRAARPAKPSSE